MSSQEQLPADQFVQRFRNELIPLTSKIQWFSLSALSEEDISASIREPFASLPPTLAQQLPQLHLYLVPYLRTSGRQADMIVFEAPDPKDRSHSFQIIGPDCASLVIATEDVSPNAYHYNLYSAVSSLAWEVAPSEVRQAWSKSIKEEMKRGVHGEIDEISWQRKNEVLAKQSQPMRDSKLLRAYLRASFIDTMTLFLHGICCDIDVEPSPRQIPSVEIRRRLELLRGFYPLAEGYALFPEELSGRKALRDERLRGTPGEWGGVGASAKDTVRADLPDEREKNKEI
ncbi:MAG: hypothetical protein KJZ70_10925 [Bryobacterales bacterium]|nr:hypothetical protein [Bryobacterales bacterium]